VVAAGKTGKLLLAYICGGELSMWGFGLLGFIMLQRLAELALSKSNARWLLAHGARLIENDRMRWFTFLHSCFLLALLSEYILTRSYDLPLAQWPLIALLCAQALRYWSIATLGRRWNVRVYILPDAQLITRGPYRFLRHPNYLAVTTELIALPLCLHAYLTCIVFSAASAFLQSQRVRVEEQALRETANYSTMASRPRGVFARTR